MASNPLKMPDELFATGNIITFGVVPVRVDLINMIDGVSFDEARRTAVRGSYGSITVNFIGRDQLIRNKQATSRTRDRADAEELSQ